MVFREKSHTLETLLIMDIEMLDLKQLTVDVCRIATEADHF